VWFRQAAKSYLNPPLLPSLSARNLSPGAMFFSKNQSRNDSAQKPMDACPNTRRLQEYTLMVSAGPWAGSALMVALDAYNYALPAVRMSRTELWMIDETNLSN
jgi:hypothetical protein